MEIYCLLCETQNQILALLFFGGVFVLYFIYDFCCSRRIKFSKLAKKYNLKYQKKEILKLGIFKWEFKYNLVSGSIKGIDINFFDYYNSNPISIIEIIDKDKETREAVKGLAKSLLRKNKIPSERVSFLKIGGVKKIIGFRRQSWTIAKYSKNYCLFKTVEIILNEIDKLGSSETFDNLKMGEEKKFYFFDFPFVEEVREFPRD